MPMKLKIVKDSNPIMKKKSLPVALPLSKEDKDTLDAMLDYLKLSQDDEYAKKHNIRAGIGMAAFQIGLLKRTARGRMVTDLAYLHLNIPKKN